MNRQTKADKLINSKIDGDFRRVLGIGHREGAHAPPPKGDDLHMHVQSCT